MKFSEALISTSKEIPQEAEAVSHILMLRCGMIKRLSSGFYCYLPLGFRVLHKITNIIRQEMDKAGAQEVLLPAVHPQELWEKTGRLTVLGQDMIKFKNRNQKLMILGPTHEEVITWLVSQTVKSYKKLPLILYQIQTKFRDEPRPRFGVIRTSEFIMKDAYSFNSDWESLDESYQKMYQAYCRIFERCGLNYLAVEADPGAMGGDVSNEFMALSEFGEDKIVRCEKCAYSASREVAQRAEQIQKDVKTEPQKELTQVHTPGVKSVENVARFLKLPVQKLLKTIIYKSGSEFVAVLVRGDQEINEVKLRKYLKSGELRMATPEEIKQLTGAEVGFSGPLGLNIRLIADYDVKALKNCVTGANKTDYHLLNVNPGRDFKIKEFSDLRYIEEGDICPKCRGRLEIKNAIEIGHIFKLGTRYSKPLGAKFIDKDGKEKEIIMGCYGIGVNRIAAAFIEQNYDQKGIIWKENIAPYKVILIATNTAQSAILKESDEIYDYLSGNNIEVLYDDRDIRAGMKFNDADLIGIPYQIIIGTKFLKEKKIEFRTRDKKISLDLDYKEQILEHIK